MIEAPPSPYNFSRAIADSLCVGQRRARDTDERVLLFLRMYKGNQLTEDIERDIRAAIRKALSPRHVPSYIFEVNDIPVCMIRILSVSRARSMMALSLTGAFIRPQYTVNNKKIEIAIKQIVSSGKSLTPSGTVSNPASFKEYYKFYYIESVVNSQRSSITGDPREHTPRKHDGGKNRVAGKGGRHDVKAKL